MQTQIRPAQIEDIEKLLELMKAYYTLDRLHFNERNARFALNQMVREWELGCFTDNGTHYDQGMKG